MASEWNGLSILILAAGRARRMRGEDKLLQMAQGQPVLRHLTQQALRIGLPVLVALPRNGADARRAALDGLQVRMVEVAEPEIGMSESLSAGIRALPADCTGVMLLLADMPGITANDMTAVVRAYIDAGSALVVRGATAQGAAGHPVIFPARLFPQLIKLTGDQGARDILNTEDVKLVILPTDHAVLDLDTPEDWADWHASQPEI